MHRRLLALLAVVAGIVFAVTVNFGTGELDDMRAELAANRAQARRDIEGRCHQSNDEAGRARLFARDAAEGLVTLALALRQNAPLPPGTRPALDAYRADQKAKAERTWPFRDCTAAGIDRYLEKRGAPIVCVPAGDGFCAP